MEREDIRLITKICHFYYNEYLTQSQIAARMGITRQMVSRLLQKAKQEGIVQIQINSPTIAMTELELKLEKKYGLQEAIVIQGDFYSHENLKEKLGIVAANYLQQQLAPGLKIGVGWGTTLRAMAEYFSKNNRITYSDVRIIQLMGGVNNVGSSVLAQDIVRLIATSIGAKEYYLHAPCIVENVVIRNTLLSEIIIKEVIEQYKDLDLAFLGIGTINNKNSIVAKSGNIKANELHQLRELRAVGEICLRYFDREGNFLTTPLMDRVIGANIDELRKAKNLIAVAGGTGKEEAILGVLRSGLLKVLITDEDTAKYAINAS